MIYSENAPELEHRLHTEFSGNRMNLVNPRKEFFYVSLEEIDEWAKRENFDLKLTKIAEARSFRESQAIRLRGEAQIAGLEMDDLEDQIDASIMEVEN